MPTWSEILAEAREPLADGGESLDFDGVRRKYLLRLHEHTGRNVVLYASAWVQKRDISAPGAFFAIDDEDIQALMEVTAGLHGSEVDVVLHSPGGSPESAEALVSYLRARFSHIRVIVPNLAMSAATMVACAADEIVMGKHSFLGPTDPQVLLSERFVPAQGILDEFAKAKRECVDHANLPVWLPILRQYAPGDLTLCETALNLSRELVRSWLETYMFAQVDDKADKAKSVSEWLADHTHFKSHSRHISRSELQSHGLLVSALEDDQALQDLVLSVFHAATHIFGATRITKLVENHEGRAFVKFLPSQPALQQVFALIP